jgi:hypothetical protein
MIDDATIERARAVQLEDELARRGINLRRTSKAEREGPCPVCGGDNRFSINVRKQVWNCRWCQRGGKGAIDMVLFLDGLDARKDFGRAIEVLTGDPGNVTTKHHEKRDQDDDERRQHEKAAWFWSQRRPLLGSVAERYLRGRRRIGCPLPPTLAFLPPTKPGHHPAMISAYALPVELESGELGAPRDVTAVHLTLLKTDGSDKADVKPNKLMLGSPGALPIALAPINDLLGLAVTEGIENGLSAHQANGFACWAAGSWGRMEKIAVSVPRHIESVTIFGDADQVGEYGAQGLARALHERWVKEKWGSIEVRIIQQQASSP